MARGRFGHEGDRAFAGRNFGGVDRRARAGGVVTITTAVQLLATTALIMGGTQHPLSFPTDPDDFVNTYMGQAVNNYIAPDNWCARQYGMP